MGIEVVNEYAHEFGSHDGRLDALDAGLSVRVRAYEIDMVPPNDDFLLHPDGTVTLIRAGDPFDVQQ